MNIRLRRQTWRGAYVAVLAFGLLTNASPVRAQSGPLTEGLREEEPTDYAFRLGSFLFSPNLTIHEFGLDTNVFDEPTNPQRDFTVGLRPDVQIFANLGVFRFAGEAASGFTYFHRHSSERSIARQYRGRLDGNFSLIRPFAAAAHNDTRARPNDEIDLRARRAEDEVTVGVAAAVSPIARVFVMFSRVETTYDDDVRFRDVNLADALNRAEATVAGGLRLQATPFTTVTVSGRVSHDRFTSRAERDAASRSARLELEFAPEAIIRGRAALAFQSFRPSLDDYEPYSGLVGKAGITYQVSEMAALSVDATRSVQYSFDQAEQHFVDTGIELVWTQRVFGAYDVRGGVSRQRLAYATAGEGDDPVVNGYQIGVGYHLREESRLGLTYEYAQRVAENRPDRHYDRRRLFASYTYGFRR